MKTVVVPVKSAWWSKINWLQAAGIAASLGVMFGVPLTPEVITSVIVGIQAVVAVATVVIKTFFTKTVTPGSI